ncbi:MAG: hypothetical protein ACE5DX_05345 [Candidatus Dojkabacteria bacterium]
MADELQGTDVSPKKGGNNTMKIVIVIVVVLAILCILCIAGVFGFSYFTFQSVTGVVNDITSETVCSASISNSEGVYTGHTSEAFRSQVTLDEFAVMATTLEDDICPELTGLDAFGAILSGSQISFNEGPSGVEFNVGGTFAGHTMNLEMSGPRGSLVIDRFSVDGVGN